MALRTGGVLGLIVVLLLPSDAVAGAQPAAQSANVLVAERLMSCPDAVKFRDSRLVQNYLDALQGYESQHADYTASKAKLQKWLQDAERYWNTERLRARASLGVFAVSLGLSQYSDWAGQKLSIQEQAAIDYTLDRLSTDGDLIVDAVTHQLTDGSSIIADQVIAITIAVASSNPASEPVAAAFALGKLMGDGLDRILNLLIAETLSVRELSSLRGQINKITGSSPKTALALVIQVTNAIDSACSTPDPTVATTPLYTVPVAPVSVATGSESGCTTTVRPSSSVVQAVRNAAPGSIICLEGFFNVVEFKNVKPGGLVTLRRLPSATTAQLSPRLIGATNIRFADLTLYDMRISGCSTDIEILKSTFLASQPGLTFENSEPCADPVRKALLLDDVRFDGVGQSIRIEYPNREVKSGGVVYLSGVKAVEVKQSVFWGNPKEPTNGIVLLRSSGITVGPGNRFENIGDYSANDYAAIIDVSGNGNTIAGNLFLNNERLLKLKNASNAKVENNVFDGTTRTSEMWLTSTSGLTFQHNTATNIMVGVGDDEVRATTNATLQYNIMIGSSQFVCGNCTFQKNLFDDAVTAGKYGGDPVVGVPTFVAPTTRISFEQWALQSGSVGKAGAASGKDIGINLPDPLLLNRPNSVRVIGGS